MSMTIGMIGWQEIISLGVIGSAVWILVRRAIRNRAEPGDCGHCASPPRSSSRGVKITELRQIGIEKPLPDSEDAEDSRPGSK
jgi:hypothetical protein